METLLPLVLGQKCLISCQNQDYLPNVRESEKKKGIIDWRGSSSCFLLCFFWGFYFVFTFFRASSVAYGSFQGRGWIRATAAGLHHRHRIWAMSVTYTTAHRNARSPTHWTRLGIEPTSLWILVGFIYTVPQQELPRGSFSYLSLLGNEKETLSVILL